jgi:diacylglycerol O-acyltransferase / wax synthase
VRGADGRRATGSGTAAQVGPPGPSAPRLERVSADDLLSLVQGDAAQPLIGAVLLLGNSADLDPARLTAVIGARLPAIPRLRQRLLRLPFGLGRPIWIDDPAFDLADHVSAVPCPSPGGQDGLLALASRLLSVRLPEGRALWAATIVTDVAEGRAALIFVIHHVLADGVAGLAVLGRLVDGGQDAPAPPFPAPAPTRAQLLLDTLREGFGALRRFPVALRQELQVLSRVAPLLRQRLAFTSLNRPTGTGKRFVTVTCDLEGLHAAAQAQGAHLNDALLGAVSGALSRLMAERGEPLKTVVVSVPASLRRRTTAQQLGNQAGLFLLRIPVVSGPVQRLRAVAELSRTARHFPLQAAGPLLYPAFRLLAAFGLYTRFIDHQRVNQTFVSNLRGPEGVAWLGGHPVEAIIPLSTRSGNITVSFTALSYQGTFTVTLNADPQTCPDLERLQALLDAELSELIGPP